MTAMRRRSHGLRILITVCTVCIAAVVVPAPARAMHAEAPGFSDPGSPRPARGTDFSIGASIGELVGGATELAYQYPLGRKTTLSELTWDLKNVAVAGVQASAGFGGRFRLNLGCWWAIDGGSGMMVDRDWLYSPSASIFLTPSDDNWTDESRHPDTTVDAGTMVDVNLTAQVVQSGPFSLRGIVGFRSDTWRWSARGGTYLYSVDDFRDTAGAFESGQEVIAYEQQYAIPYVGLGASWRRRALSVESHVLLSAAVSASDRDNHVLRDTIFEGDFSGGSYVGLGFNACWAFAPRWSATLGVEYQSISSLTGDVTITAPEIRAVDEDGGGIAMHAAAISLGAGYRF